MTTVSNFTFSASARTHLFLDISIDGDTAVAFTENVEQRFLAYGWQVLHVDNGDRYILQLSFKRPAYTLFHSDLKSIYESIAEARKEHSKPTIVRLRTTIGFGSKLQGTHGVHGARECIRTPC